MTEWLAFALVVLSVATHVASELALYGWRGG